MDAIVVDRVETGRKVCSRKVGDLHFNLFQGYSYADELYLTPQRITCACIRRGIWVGECRERCLVHGLSRYVCSVVIVVVV